MNEISNLCSAVANAINEAKIIPNKAEFQANFKIDVEKFRGDSLIYVCPHSQCCEIDSRSTLMRTIAVDVVLQYKLRSESQEEAVEDLGSDADALENFLFNLDIGPYRFLKTEYYPYHGESLKESRVFVSIITVTYRGMARFVKNRKAFHAS
jgi:hypothetical protein